MLNFNTLDYLPLELKQAADEGALLMPTHRELRMLAASQAKHPAWAEFGVADGTSFQQFLGLLKQRPNGWHIVGFDSFEGFPTNWDWGDGVRNTPAGKFVGRYDCGDPRGHIVQGWFDETLPEYDFSTDQLGLVHIDCDVYESTSSVFINIDELLGHDTVLVFDEISGYPNYAEHEWRAYQEWKDMTGKWVEWFGLSLETTEQRPHELHGAAGFVRLPT